MNKKSSIILAALALPFLSAPSVSSAAALDACPSLAGLTTATVKHIGTIDEDDIYLDKDGNRVMPCRSENGTKFYLLSGYKDGDKLYAKSKSQELNKNFYHGAINIDMRNSVISFGGDRVQVTDMYEFQKQYQTNMISDGELPSESVAVGNGLERYLYVNPEWASKLPSKYAERTPEEKQKLIKTHYLQIAERYQNLESDTSDFEEYAVEHSREIRPTEDVINQYTLDAELASLEDENGSPRFSPNLHIGDIPYGEIDGGLFLRYKAAIAENEYNKAVPSFFLDVLSGNEFTLDQKLAIAHRLATKPNLLKNLSKEYAAEKIAFIEENKENIELLDAEGKKEYQALSDDEKIKYNKLVAGIDNAIYNVEYGDLASEISKQDYEKLSDIDKAKYAKIRANSKKKGIYAKLPVEDVLAYAS